MISMANYYNSGGFIGIDFGFISSIPFAPIIKQQKVQVGNAEGYECTDCKDFYPLAELNQPDNANEYTSFTCYGCRKGLKTIF